MNNYRYYAFVDLLGYRDLVEDDLRSHSTTLKDKLTKSFDSLTNINEADVGINAISDSIFVSLNNSRLGFPYFISVLINLQRTFLSNGLLLRGGVAFNEHFQNSKVTYSPALVEAYRLESERAFFPRILIHENVIEKLRNENSLEAVIGREIVAHAGLYQTHFISDDYWSTALDHLRELAIKHSSLLRKDPRVYAKHWYLEDYLRTFKPKGKSFKKYLPSWRDS